MKKPKDGNSGRSDDDDACFDPEKNPALKKEIKMARRVMSRQLPQARHPVGDAGAADDNFR